MVRSQVRVLAVGCVALAAFAGVGCRRSQPAAPPLATPKVALSHDRVVAGSGLEISYRFEVAPDARFPEDYRVFVHVVDTDGEQMWDDDHNPPVPTTQWKPGQVVEYKRTIFVPIFPYVGEATIQAGLHSTKDGKRVSLAGETSGQRAYKVARLQLLPQTESLFTVFKDGWHPVEAATPDGSSNGNGRRSRARSLSKTRNRTRFCTWIWTAQRARCTQPSRCRCRWAERCSTSSTSPPTCAR